MTRTSWGFWLALSCLAVACAEGPTLLEARKGFETTLTREVREADGGLPAPPPSLFTKVEVPTALGPMGAYLGVAPEEGTRHPAIVWLVGGFPAGGAGEFVWEEPDPENDQSAQAYRHAGLVMLYPTLRGSYGNPGHQETFFGEVDDVLAAIEYLRHVDYVDPNRIYLGGHSTGGTLALLVAASTERLKGVIAFGPVGDPSTYGDEVLTYDPANAKERELRSPIRFLSAIKVPTLVIEGEGGNYDSLLALRDASTNPKVRFAPILGGGHFDILAPLNDLLAPRLAAMPRELSMAELAEPEELAKVYADHARAQREAADLSNLAELRARGVSLREPVKVEHYLFAREREPLAAAREAAGRAGFEPSEVEERTDRDGDTFYALVLRKSAVLGNLELVFAISDRVRGFAREHDLYYSGWDVE
ncbi:MAG: alpha/beta fold hydrolase [Planctomycetota bacterium]